MRRHRFRKSVIGISLFPFLAVLICTMGTLIVLLILVVQQARVNADTIAAEKRQQQAGLQADRTRRQQEREDWEWQREMLEAQRGELTERLADRRRKLSHLEDHIHRLETDLKRLQAEAQEMERLKAAGSGEQSTAQAELARLQAEIARERQRLEEARQQAASRSRSYAIIPYRGPNGTARRPIYIECRESGITLQPEGIRFGPEDFTGPLGPGNPLDATLRAIREHWARTDSGHAQGEPYPLLVVRPDGAMAYAMARAAMASWDDEFGYELVEADMDLSFPPSDPALKKLLAGTIEAARQRQAILAAAMPSRFDEKSSTRFTPADRNAPATASRVAAGTGEGYGFAAGGSGSGSADGDGTGNPLRASGTGSASDQPPAGDVAGGPPAKQQLAQFAGTSAARATGATGAAAAGAGGTDAAGEPGGQPGGAAMQSMATSTMSTPSMAAKGENWGLPNVAAGSTGITRPIRVECHPDRLVILPDRRDPRPAQVIKFRGSTQNSVEEFVAGVWTHMEYWGMAVAGGYWKPVLKVEVFPDAEVRYIELEALLRSSGLVVEKR